MSTSPSSSSSSSPFQNQRTVIVRLLPAELAEQTFEDSPLCTCNYCTRERVQNPQRYQKQQEKWKSIVLEASSTTNNNNNNNSSPFYLPTSVIHWDFFDTSLPPHHQESMMSSQRNTLLDLQLQAMHDHCFPLEYDDRFYNWCKFGMNHVILLAMQKSGLVKWESDSSSTTTSTTTAKTGNNKSTAEKRPKVISTEENKEETKNFASRLENLLSGGSLQQNNKNSLMTMMSGAKDDDNENEDERKLAQQHQSFLERLKQPSEIDKFIKEQKKMNRRFLPPKTGLRMVRGDSYQDEFNGRTKYDTAVNEIITASLKEYYLFDRMTKQQQQQQQQSNNNNNTVDDENSHSTTAAAAPPLSEIQSRPCIYETRISPCLEGYDQIQGIAVSRIIPPTKTRPLIASVLVGQQCVTPPPPSREALGALAYIATLGVRDDSRGKGLATELIRRTLEECSGNFGGNVCEAPWMKEKLESMKMAKPTTTTTTNHDHDVEKTKEKNEKQESPNEKQGITKNTTTSKTATIIPRSDACLFRCNRVYLHCLDTNIPALKLYANLGFEATDTLRNYYFIEGVWRDGIVLTRPIINRPEPTRHSLAGHTDYDLTGEEEDDEVLRRMAKGEIVGEGPPKASNLVEANNLNNNNNDNNNDNHWSSELMRVIALLTPAAVAAAMLF